MTAQGKTEVREMKIELDRICINQDNDFVPPCFSIFGKLSGDEKGFICYNENEWTLSLYEKQGLSIVALKEIVKFIESLPPVDSCTP